MDKISRAALMTSALMVGGAAGAVPVTMSQRINLGNALNAGQSVSGGFDISSLLFDINGAPVTLDLSSARLTAFAYSDAAMSFSQSNSGNYQVGSSAFYYSIPQQGVYYYTYSYDCGSWWSSRTCYAQAAYYYTYYVQQQGYVAHMQNDRTTTGADSVVDQGAIAVGDQTAADSVAYTQSGLGVQGYAGGYYQQYSQSYAESYQTRLLYQENQAAGALDFVMDLNEANLVDLEADGLLNFALSMLVGRSTFNWIQLDIIGEQVAIVEEPTDVPEPGAIALLGLGVLGVGLGRRARDRRRKAA